MINLFLIIPLLASFLITLFLMPAWIRKAKAINLVWDDMNKLKRPPIAGSGGIIMILGFIAGIFLFIAYGTFYNNSSTNLVELLSVVLVIIISSSIGFIDDLIGWKRGGLSRKSRVILLLLIAIPLMAINTGRHEALIPFLGTINIAIIYPLLFIPIGVIGATTTFNFIAGFNGLEAGQGILILSALTLVAYLRNNHWLAFIALCMVVSLLAFLVYNFYPAKVFPGDALTYGVGALIASIAIIGSLEKIAIFFFTPYILETILKLKGKLQKHSFGIPKQDGTIDKPYNKIYGLEHASIILLKKMGIKSTEKNIVYLLWIFQIIIIIAGFIIFREGIFTT